MKKKLAIYRNGNYWHVREKNFWGIKWNPPCGCGITRESAIADYIKEAKDSYRLPSRNNPEVIEIEI